MSCFRKRTQKVLKGSRCEAHFVVSQIGEDTYVSQRFEPTKSELEFANPSPTLDQQLNAGVQVKEVNVDGILDSYDVNDTPLEKFEEKIITKGRKSKKAENKEVESKNVE